MVLLLIEELVDRLHLLIVFLQQGVEMQDHIMVGLVEHLGDQVVVELQNQEEHLEDQVHLIKVILEEQQVRLLQVAVVEQVLLEEEILKLQVVV